MSENLMEVDENAVHYVYGDQEYIVGKEEGTSELGDFICADGSRAILVDGQYIVTDSQTILLQDGDSNLTQYYINDNNEGFVIGGEDTSVNNLFDGAEILQLVEEDTNDSQQIIYYTNEEPTNEESTSHEASEEMGVEGVQDVDGNVYSLKRIQLEGQLLDFEDIVQSEEEENSNDENGVEQNSVGYAVMEDGSFRIVDAKVESATAPSEDDQSEHSSDAQMVDLSRITGRNLITGQTVTLHSYMEKLKKKLRYNVNLDPRVKAAKRVYEDEVRKCELTDLLDKKISIGTTKSGKKIVGKIIHVGKKPAQCRNTEQLDKSGKNEEEESEDNLVISDRLSDAPEPEPTSPQSSTIDDEASPIESSRLDEQTKILVKKCSVSKQSLEQISKTLGGVMEMESVRKKLENKNIVVKLVEKRYTSDSDTFVKSTAYSYGYMEKEVVLTENEVAEKWKFVHDQNTQDVLLWDNISNEELVEDISKLQKKTKFPITTSLTIVVSYGKGGNKTIRVNLNPAPGNLCTICAQYFKTNLQLRQHMHHVHNTYGNNMTCEVCEKTFYDPQKFQEHRDVHVQEGKLFVCSECDKCFSSQAKLNKHFPSHDLYLRPLECSVCEVRCASEWALKKHLLTHTGIKPFSCDICNKQFLTQYDVNFHKKIHFPEKHFACSVCLRTFSRHSNLLRHTEIHKGSGTVYKCEICYCSYNYISSLTRHMVQNHLDAEECRKKIKKCDNSSK